MNTTPMSNHRRCEAYTAQNGVERYTARQNRRIRKGIRRAAGKKNTKG